MLNAISSLAQDFWDSWNFPKTQENYYYFRSQPKNIIGIINHNHNVYPHLKEKSPFVGKTMSHMTLRG